MTRREPSLEEESRDLRKTLNAFFRWLYRTPISMPRLTFGKRLLIVVLSYGLGISGLWVFLPLLHNAASMLLPMICTCWLFRYRGLLISMLSMLLVVWLISLYLLPYTLLSSDQALRERAVLGFGTALVIGLAICWLRTAVDRMSKSWEQVTRQEQTTYRERESSYASQHQGLTNELNATFPLYESHELHTNGEEEALLAKRIGQQFGNYRVVELLGKGGFARVYLGEHLYLEKHLAAIKVLRPELPHKYKADFLQEAQRLLALKHPHIVSFIDFGVKEGTPFLIMEYLANGTLRTRHPKGSRIPIETVVSYVKQIASALQYIHEHKLIHRDVKPENMLLGTNGELLLSDFGIMAVAHTTGSLVEQGFAGTMAYMAPEQIQQRPRRESDQYALAVTVYEWLCGTHPFEHMEDPPFADRHLKMQYHHLQTAPPTLRDQLSTIPPAVERVVLKALAKDPRERWTSIQTFATALWQASRHTSIPSLRPVSLLPLEQSASPRERALSTDHTPTFGNSPSTR